MRWGQAGLPPLLGLGLTLALYAGSLQAGFMFDDPLDLPRASGRSFVQIFTESRESPSYRPLTFAVWRVLFLLLGRHDPMVLHGLVLALHALNGWLVYLLGRKLLGAAGGLLAMALFLWYPLNYQVVIYSNTLYHTLVTGCALIAVLSYWRWRVGQGGQVWFWTALLAGGLGLLSHENGVTIAPLVFVAEGLLRASGRVDRFAWYPTLFALEGLAFLFAWWMVPRWPTALALDLDSLRMNGLYIVQGLAYPVTGQLGHLPRWGGSDEQRVTMAATATLLVLVGVLLVRRRLQALVLGLVWSLVGALPAWVMLPWTYVQDGPRLLYMASAGTALLWAAALAPQASVWRESPRRARSVLTTAGGLALAALVLFDSAAFIRVIGRMQTQGAQVVRQLVETATLSGPEAGRVYINLPSWFALKDQGYLLGHNGVTMVPGYIGLGRSVYMHRGVQPELVSLADLERAPGWNWEHFYGPHGTIVGPDALEEAFRRGGAIYAASFPTGHVRLEYVGHLERSDARAAQAVARFGEWAVLEDVEAWREGTVVAVRLVWGVVAPPAGDATVSVEVVDEIVRRLGEGSGDSLHGMFPLRRWQQGDRIEERRTLVLQESATGQRLCLRIALVERATGERLPATDASGAPRPDGAVTVACEEG